MSYSVRFRGRALEQLNGRPGGAFDALLARVVQLVDATTMPGNDPSYRRAVFGAEWGLLIFHVDDEAELIEISDVTWIG